jgi:hypothetical protein
MSQTYTETTTKTVRAANGIEYAYRERGAGAARTSCGQALQRGGPRP